MLSSDLQSSPVQGSTPQACPGHPLRQVSLITSSAWASQTLASILIRKTVHRKDCSCLHVIPNPQRLADQILASYQWPGPQGGCVPSCTLRRGPLAAFPPSISLLRRYMQQQTCALGCVDPALMFHFSQQAKSNRLIISLWGDCFLHLEGCAAMHVCCHVFRPMPVYKPMCRHQTFGKSVPCRVLMLQKGSQDCNQRQTAIIMRPVLLALEKAIDKCSTEPMLQQASVARL